MSAQLNCSSFNQSQDNVSVRIAELICDYHFIIKSYFYKSLITPGVRFLHNFFQPLTSWRLSEAISVLWYECYLTTVYYRRLFILWQGKAQKSVTCKILLNFCFIPKGQFGFTILRRDISSSRTKTEGLDF